MPTDLDRLQGRWNVTSLEADGQQVPASALGDAAIVVQGDRFTSIAMGATYQGAVEIQDGKKPKAFDLLFTAGPEAGNRNVGIYRLSGDRWTMCLATRGTTRPRTFATPPGSGLVLQTLERAIAARTANSPSEPSPKSSGVRQMSGPTSATASSPPTELEGEWTMVAAVFDGAPMDDSMLKWCKRITRGNITTVVAGPQTILNASFTIDSSTEPRTIDCVNITGTAKGKSQAGIFELNGRTLKICMAPPGRPRPDGFLSKRGDGRSSTTWWFASK